ncbi:MAG: hypothetical protein ABSB79_00415 [Syntrophales bacterium]
MPTVINGHYYICVIAGVSGITEPSWPTSSGATMTDGTVSWQENTAIIDGTLTTQNFNQNTAEIGIHNCYDTTASNDQFFDDFGLSLILNNTNVNNGDILYIRI